MNYSSSDKGVKLRTSYKHATKEDELQSERVNTGEKVE